MSMPIYIYICIYVFFFLGRGRGGVGMGANGVLILSLHLPELVVCAGVITAMRFAMNYTISDCTDLCFLFDKLSLRV